VLATDTGDGWYADIHDGRIEPRRGAGLPGSGEHEPADCVVSGSASALYLFLWNRAEAAPANIAVSGDPGILATWQSGVRVRWG
jgi:hypothetical protein